MKSFLLPRPEIAVIFIRPIPRGSAIEMRLNNDVAFRWHHLPACGATSPFTASARLMGVAQAVRQ